MKLTIHTNYWLRRLKFCSNIYLVCESLRWFWKGNLPCTSSLLLFPVCSKGRGTAEALCSSRCLAWATQWRATEKARLHLCADSHHSLDYRIRFSTQIMFNVVTPFELYHSTLSTDKQVHSHQKENCPGQLTAMSFLMATFLPLM